MAYSPVEEKDLIGSLDFMLQERFDLGQVVLNDKFSVPEARHLRSVLSIHEAVRVEGEVPEMFADIVNVQTYFSEHQICIPLIFCVFRDVDENLKGLLFFVQPLPL